MSVPSSKQVLALSLGIFLIIGALGAACGGDDDNSKTTGPTSAVTTKASATPVVVAGTTTAKPTKAAATPADTSAPTAATSGLAGIWGGDYASTSTPGSTGTFIIDWTQTGSTLGGTISVTNTPCVTEGTITGTVEGEQITFGAVEGAYSIAYEGTVSGDTMSGTYSSPSCGNAAGTWEAAKQ